MGTNKLVERLYLCKGKEKDVFIDNSNIYDHQVEGLRYLWKQFKKKNPGVIINFPEHSGKSVTIALFLYAIHKLLLQPVLILCKDEAQVEEWHQCFNQWTEFASDEIIVQPTKALLKKKIFIKSMSDLIPFSRRSWSVLVYKNDEFIGLPQFSNVDFYIWATSTDVMKDLNFLSAIYKWMCPKTKENFGDNSWDLKKLIHLDAMLEDIVLRKTNITSHKDEDVIEYKLAKRSKNKDITGTKIKRSKINKSNDGISDITSEQSKNIKINENMKDNIHQISSKESSVFDKLQGKRHYESTHSSVVDGKVESASLLKNVEENTQSDNCILHYDETPSDIGSPVGDTNILESYSEFDFNAIDKDVFPSNADNITKHDSKPESSVLKNIIESNDDILQGINSLNKLNTLEEDDELSANNEQKEDNKDILKSENIENDINEDKNLSVVKVKDDIDSKLNEMEERAMKKFKGSFLDSIF